MNAPIAHKEHPRAKSYEFERDFEKLRVISALLLLQSILFRGAKLFIVFEPESTAQHNGHELRNKEATWNINVEIYFAFLTI